MEAERKLLESRIGNKKGVKSDNIDVKPSIFAESVFMLDGKPLRLKDRDYLLPIYNWPIEDGLLMCGRQVEKSSTFSIKIGTDTLMRPYHRALYYAPLNEQVKVFSEDRLGRLFDYSQKDVVKKQYMTSKDKQNVFNKSFSVVGSLIYLRHAYGLGDNIRGISTNSQYGDEVQDIYVDALPVISETQAHAYDLGPGIKLTWYAGTPKTFSNTIQHLWNRSNQQEWIVRCFHCGKDQVLGEKNITPDKYICSKCGMEITRENIAKNGRWVKLKQDSDEYGFRISQLICPSMPVKDVYKKMEKYPKSKFYNEVLGRSFEHAQKPIPRSLLMKLLNPESAMFDARVPPYMSHLITMGVDWGHGTSSFTIVVIMTFENGKYKTLYSHKFKDQSELDINYQKREIYRLMDAFQINYFIADYGDGFEQGQEFNLALGPRFDMCYYSWNQRELIAYDPKNMFWTVNRDRCLYWYVEDLRHLRMDWPGYDQEAVKHLIDDHEVIQIEYRSSESRSAEGNIVTRGSNTMMFTHPAGIPDDSFHASFYAWFALKILMRSPIDPTIESIFDPSKMISSAHVGYNEIDDGVY